MTRRWLTWAVDGLLLIGVVGGIIYVARQQVPAGTLRLSKADWRALTSDGVELGDTTGSVTIVEFVDYQCPVCAQVEPLLARLDQQFPGRIRRVVRHLPIESIHPQALVAAKAVECARDQAAADRMHDLLFGAQPLLKSLAFDTLGRAAGVPDPHGFSTCLNAAEHPRIRRDMDLAASLGVSGTPTIVVEALLLTSFSPTLLISLVKSRLD